MFRVRQIRIAPDQAHHLEAGAFTTATVEAARKIRGVSPTPQVIAGSLTLPNDLTRHSELVLENYIVEVVGGRGAEGEVCYVCMDREGSHRIKDCTCPPLCLKCLDQWVVMDKKHYCPFCRAVMGEETVLIGKGPRIGTMTWVSWCNWSFPFIFSGCSKCSVYRCGFSVSIGP